MPNSSVPTPEETHGSRWAETGNDDIYSHELREKEQRMLHQKELFKFGGVFLIIFISASFLIAVISIFLVVYGANWHILFASTALLIPPTVLSIALVRGVYRSKDENTELPTTTIIQETVKESIKALGIKTGSS